MPASTSKRPISTQSEIRGLTEGHDGSEDEQKYTVSVQDESKGTCQTLQGHVLGMRPSSCRASHIQRHDLHHSTHGLRYQRLSLRNLGALRQMQHLATTAPAYSPLSAPFTFAYTFFDTIHGNGATCRSGLTPTAGTPGAQVLNQPPGKDDHCKDQDEHSNDHHRHISGMVCMHRPGCHGVACIVWTERGSEDAICVIESRPAL